MTACINNNGRAAQTGQAEKNPETEMLCVRDLSREDLPQLAALEREIFSSPWSLSSFQSTYDSGYSILLGAFAGNCLAGYCTMNRSFETADITIIAVRDIYRGKGLGRRLLEAAMEKARTFGVTEFALEVRVSNAPAVHLYESMGFVKEGLRKKYYTRPVEDAYIYWRHENGGHL